MEKEKILRQLEEKLLPSVQNLEKGQATDHDFLPALLWMLLEKSKDSESALKNISSKHSDELEKAFNDVIGNYQKNQQNSNQLIEQKISTLTNDIETSLNNTSSKHSDKLEKAFNDVISNYQKNQQNSNQLIEQKISTLANNIANLLKSIKSEQSKELENTSIRIIENTQENRKVYGEQLNKAVNFISSKSHESSVKIEQAFNEKFKKIINATLDNHKISQEKTNELENKILIISQKVEELKYEQSKKDKKFSMWLLSFSIFQIISLIILAIILMK
jgi:hypothetical protein